jgi:hypothetical protein
MPESTRMTELDLLVGSMFTTRPEEDRDLFEEEREWLSGIQDWLREEGIEVDLLSRPGVEIWEGGIDRFLDLYQLRRIAAYLEHGRDPSPILKESGPIDSEIDPLLAAIWDGEETTRFPQLINHQPDGGYYLPVDFPEPIWLANDDADDIDDEAFDDTVASFGSSVALQRELVEIEQLFQQARIPLANPAYRCLKVLREAADQSVASDLPIIIW